MQTITDKSLDQQLIQGVEIHSLTTQEDSRGSLTEIFRQSWIAKKKFCQWNLVENKANTLRGVHVHPKHTDFLLVLTGSLSIGLLDLRENSPTFNKGCLIELTSKPMQAILIPNGVAHGFYSEETSSHIYGVDQYWNPDDELGCHWAETKIFLHWPFDTPILSDRDQCAQTLESLRRQLKSWQSSLI